MCNSLVHRPLVIAPEANIENESLEPFIMRVESGFASQLDDAAAANPVVGDFLGRVGIRARR